MNHIRLALVGVISAGTLASGTAEAAVFAWTGNTSIDADWNTATNWNQGSVPVNGSNGILINSGSSAFNPVIYDTGVTTSLGTSSTLGGGGSDSGYLAINSGVLEFAGGTTKIGDGGEGSIVVNSGATLRKGAGEFTLGDDAGATGSLRVNTGGTFHWDSGNNTVYVGRSGDGVMELYGGAFTIANSNTRNVEVGLSTGQGVLDIRGGSISAAGSSNTQTLKIGATNNTTFSGNGTLRGYGSINMVGTHGIGTMNLGGYVIADGTEADNSTVADHTLNIQTAGANDGLLTVDNTSGVTHFGWYTQSKGAISRTVTIKSNEQVIWGDDAPNASYFALGSPTTAMVNSAYVHDAGSADGTESITIALLDPTRTTAVDGSTPLPSVPAGVAFLNIWELTPSVEKTFDVFTVRYDESFSDVNAADLYDDITGFYYWDGASASWIDLTADSTVDTANFLAGYSAAGVTIGAGESGFFALAATVPEPSSLLLIASGLTLVAWRQRGGVIA